MEEKLICSICGKKLSEERGNIFYMRYIKVIILAIMEVIADFYTKKYDKR